MEKGTRKLWNCLNLEMCECALGVDEGGWASGFRWFVSTYVWSACVCICVYVRVGV